MLDELEARLREDPYDDGRWLVLEDYLLETEDLRAVIVRCEHARMRREALAARDAVTPLLLGAHHEAIASQLVGVWRAGYLVDAAFDAHAVGVDLLEPLVAAPATAVLRALTVRCGTPDAAARVIASVAAARCATSLRSLTIEGRWLEQARGPTIDIAGLALRRLFLADRRMRLVPSPAVGALTSLLVSPHHDGELAQLLAAPLPAVRDLVVGVRALAVDALAALLGGDATPALATLQLVDVPPPRARALLEALASSALLPRLRTLALGNLRVPPASRGPAFAHLEVLALPPELAAAKA
jgi:hypothetical protein|nr:hypothetical protein [Kofleriaceae bacterium]